MQDGSNGSSTTLFTTATTTSTTSNNLSKLHKPSKGHKEMPPKALKETKSAFRDSGFEPSKSPKEHSRKPKENQPLRDIKPQMAFREPSSLSKEHYVEGMNNGSVLGKRTSNPKGYDHQTKKHKKGFADSSGKPRPELNSQFSDKKLPKGRLHRQTSKLQPEGDNGECRKTLTLPPFQALVDPSDSDIEDQSNKSEVSELYLLSLIHY